MATDRSELLRFALYLLTLAGLCLTPAGLGAKPAEPPPLQLWRLDCGSVEVPELTARRARPLSLASFASGESVTARMTGSTGNTT